MRAWNLGGGPSPTRGSHFSSQPKAVFPGAGQRLQIDAPTQEKSFFQWPELLGPAQKHSAGFQSAGCGSLRQHTQDEHVCQTPPEFKGPAQGLRLLLPVPPLHLTGARPSGWPSSRLAASLPSPLPVTQIRTRPAGPGLRTRSLAGHGTCLGLGLGPASSLSSSQFHFVGTVAYVLIWVALPKAHHTTVEGRHHEQGAVAGHMGRGGVCSPGWGGC